MDSVVSQPPSAQPATSVGRNSSALSRASLSACAPLAVIVRPSLSSRSRYVKAVSPHDYEQSTTKINVALRSPLPRPPCRINSMDNNGRGPEEGGQGRTARRHGAARPRPYCSGLAVAGPRFRGRRFRRASSAPRTACTSPPPPSNTGGVRWAGWCVGRLEGI